MPRSRMQHIAALPCGKSCSAYAANWFASTLKNYFLLTTVQVTKTVELILKKTTSKLRMIFLSDWLFQFWNFLPSYASPKIMSTLQSMANIDVAKLWWDFAKQFFMPAGLSQHAEALPKLRHIDVHIILASYRVARPHFVAFCHTA